MMALLGKAPAEKTRFKRIWFKPDSVKWMPNIGWLHRIEVLEAPGR